MATPGSILAIGSGNSNHFQLDYAPNGASSIATLTQDDISSGTTIDPYFVVNPAGTAVQFWARLDGATTPNSHYPRSELRELNADGSKMFFNAFVGTHTLHGFSRITHLPPNKPEVIVAQLHDDTSDAMAIRTRLQSGKINLVAEVNGSQVALLQSPYTVGTEFEWGLKIVGGNASLYYQDFSKPVAPPTKLTSTNSASFYFKSGCYDQSNTTYDSASEHCSVELRGLSVTHSGTFVTTGLTNGGVTNNFTWSYDSSLAGPGGIEPARTNAAIAACEADLAWVKTLFGGGVTVKGLTVLVTANFGGASWTGSINSSTVQINASGVSYSGNSGFVRFLLIAELCEIFMLGQGVGWFNDTAHNEGSMGEGLSRLIGNTFLANNGLLGSGVAADYGVTRLWINSARVDNINDATTSDNTPDTLIGGLTLFLDYLNTKLGYSLPSIIAAGSKVSMAQVYRNVSGRSDNPFGAFKATVDALFPSQTGNVLTGPNPDNPYVTGGTAPPPPVPGINAAPTPAIPTFVDGTVPHAVDLNAVAANLRNLYNYTLGGFRTVKPAAAIHIGVAASTIPNGVNTQALLDTADINTDNMFNSPNQGALTVVTAGTYRLFLQIQHDGAVAPLGVRILVNGTSIATNTVAVTTGNADSLSCSATVQLSAGATVYPFVAQFTGGTVNLKVARGGCRFVAEWLSP